MANYIFKQNQLTKADSYYREAIQIKLEQINTLLPTLSDKQRKSFVQTTRIFLEDYTNFVIQAYPQQPQLIAELFDLRLST